MADLPTPKMLIFSAKSGDFSTVVEFSGTDWRARVMSGKSSAEIAADVVRALNAHDAARKALRSVRTACRDDDTDTALPSAVGEEVEAALALMGDRP